MSVIDVANYSTIAVSVDHQVFFDGNPKEDLFVRGFDIEDNKFSWWVSPRSDGSNLASYRTVTSVEIVLTFAVPFHQTLRLRNVRLSQLSQGNLFGMDFDPDLDDEPDTVHPHDQPVFGFVADIVEHVS